MNNSRILNEWVYANGNKVTLNNITNKTTSAPAAVSYKDKFTKLAKHMKDTFGNFLVHALTDTYFYVEFDAGTDSDLELEIDASTSDIEVLLDYGTGDFPIIDDTFASWDDVLKELEDQNVILNKKLCESVSLSTIDDFKLYENLWDSLNEGADKLLWKNKEGTEIDLNDPVAVQQELEAEKKRYQAILSDKFSKPTRGRKPKFAMSRGLDSVAARAAANNRTLADEIAADVAQHIKRYKNELEREKYLLDPDSFSVPNTKQDVKYSHNKATYDLTNEAEAIDYINRRLRNNLSGAATPEKRIAKLKMLKKEITPELAFKGHPAVAKKIIAYIDRQIAEAEQERRNIAQNADYEENQLALF